MTWCELRQPKNNKPQSPAAILKLKTTIYTEPKCVTQPGSYEIPRYIGEWI